MGYYISLRDSDFFIPAEKKEEALLLFKENMLAHVNTLGRGGSWADGGKKESWFSWTRTEYLENAKTIEEVIEHFGWETELDTDGNIVELDFGNEKIGQEELLFQTIAPCVRAGSYLEIQGEGTDLWRWYFTGEEMKTQQGRVLFGDE